MSTLHCPFCTVQPHQTNTGLDPVNVNFKIGQESQASGSGQEELELELEKESAEVDQEAGEGGVGGEEEKEEDEEGVCDQGALPAGSGMTNGELSRLSIVCPDAPT